jgi:thymidylate synthase (FAD)
VIVELIAHTVVTGWEVMRRAGWVQHEDDIDTVYGPMKDETWLDADYLAEFAGRNCYQSWDRPNPATATNQTYLENIQHQQHHSVLEHASASFYVAEVSRSLSHELVRHRHLSFSQISQRYVESDQCIAIIPPAVENYDDHLATGLRLSKIVGAQMSNAIGAYERIVAQLIGAGLTRKQAREAARAVLPNATETRFVVSGNMRAWRDVIAKRNSEHADAEIHAFAGRVLEHLKTVAPNTFQDM